MIESRDAVGLAAAAAAAGLAWGAFRSLAAGRERAALACTLLAALVVRAFAAGDLELHEWDESYHALVAKNLARHPGTPTLVDDPVLPFDPAAWTRNHVWLHKQPLALWTMAASVAAFGANAFAVRAPSVLLSTASAALVWTLGRALGGPRVALFAGLLHALNAMSIALAAGRMPTDHVDSMFGTLVLAAIALAAATRRRAGIVPALGVGAVVGLAALAKSPAALFVLAPFAVLRAEGRGVRRAIGEAAAAGVAAAAVFAPWQIHAARTWPVESAIERSYDVSHWTRALEGHGGGVGYHLARLPRYCGDAAPFALLWFVMRVARGALGELAPRHAPPSSSPPRLPSGAALRAAARDVPLELAVLLWIRVPYAFFSAAATKMPAYVFVSAPAIGLVVALAADRLLASSLSGGRRAAAFAAAVLLLALPVHTGLEKMKPLGSAPWRPSWTEDLRAAERALAAAPPASRTVVFNAPDPVRAMFATTFVAYDGLPDEAALAACRARGARVLVWDDGRVPDALRARGDIRFVGPRGAPRN